MADAREANFETKKNGLKLQDLRRILLQYNEPTIYVPRQTKHNKQLLYRVQP